MAKAEQNIFSVQNNTPLDVNKITFVFVHGSPGDHKAYKKYFEDPDLKSQFNLISIDRPGFGKSIKFKKQILIPEQSKMIADHLKTNLGFDKLKNKKFIVSHSYGAPLSVVLAQDLDFIDGLILMAGPFTQEYNEIRWYNYAAKWGLIKFLLSQSWNTSNEEMFSLNDDLNKVKEDLKNYNGQTHFLHGNNDGLVDVKNSKWAHNFRLENHKTSFLKIYKSNHFFIWTKFDLIKKYLLKIE
jgi:pimeloyl-ACP methyl ester carboxylesterase